MVSYSNDAPYCLLPSCKKLESFNGQFCRKCKKKTNFRHLIPRLRLFFKIPALSLSLLYWPLTSCKISETTEISKDGRADYGQGWLHKTPLDKFGSKIDIWDNFGQNCSLNFPFFSYKFWHLCLALAGTIKN